MESEVQNINNNNITNDTNKQWIIDLTQENGPNKINNNIKEENVEMKELNMDNNNNLKSENDNKENININNELSYSNKENKKINNPSLNYNYGDNVDTETIKEISNSNIKINVRDNLDYLNNHMKNIKQSYNNKKLNINYDLDKDKALNDNNFLKPIKSYSLYNEFKRKYINHKNFALKNNRLNKYYQQSNYKNYINTNLQRNYLTVDSNYGISKVNFSIIEKGIKTPLRNFYKNKLYNNNSSYNEYKISSFTPNKYLNFNNHQNEINSPNIKGRISYLENKLAEYEKEKNNYINEIKTYKNSFEIISDFFTFISNNFIPDFFPNNPKIQLNNENILYLYFKNLKDYISKLNREVSDYKYKYEKLLDIDSNRPSISTKNTLNINKQTKEYKTQNNSFSEICDNMANSVLDNNNNDNINNNIDTNNDNDIYKSLEKRVVLLEKELLLKKDKDNDNKIRPNSGPKIMNRKEIKKKKKNNLDNNGTVDNNNNDGKNIRHNYLSHYNSNLNSKSKKDKNIKKNKIYKIEKYKKK